MEGDDLWEAVTWERFPNNPRREVILKDVSSAYDPGPVICTRRMGSGLLVTAGRASLRPSDQILGIDCARASFGLRSWKASGESEETASGAAFASKAHRSFSTKSLSRVCKVEMESLR